MVAGVRKEVFKIDDSPILMQNLCFYGPAGSRSLPSRDAMHYNSG